MAIDTVAKRYSALIANLPIYSRTVIPDGTVAKADRQTIALCYGGISAGAAAVVATLTAIIAKRAFIRNRLVAVSRNRTAKRIRTVQ